MKLYNHFNGKLTNVGTQSFQLEKDIQNLVEKNLNELFNLEFVKSELTFKNFRFDTLAFDKENNSFVIIEYKKEKNFSVIDQGYTYMSILLNNKADFILEYHAHCGVTLKKEEVDWSQSKVIFVSPFFTEYQKNSVNFKDVPFELWEIKRYENGMIGLNQFKTNSEESIATTSKAKGSVVSTVTQQVKVHTEEYLINKSKTRPEWVKEIYKSMRERILNLGEIEVVPRGSYVCFKRNQPVTDIFIHDAGLYVIVNMKKNSLRDPQNLAEAFNGAKHMGMGDYYININQDTDIDYTMSLISQSYKNQGV